jgi:hypothetical protein
MDEPILLEQLADNYYKHKSNDDIVVVVCFKYTGMAIPSKYGAHNILTVAFVIVFYIAIFTTMVLYHERFKNLDLLHCMRSILIFSPF